MNNLAVENRSIGRNWHHPASFLMPEEGLGSHFLHPLHCHLRGKYIRKPHEILYGIHAPTIKPQGMHSYIVLHWRLVLQMCHVNTRCLWTCRVGSGTEVANLGQVFWKLIWTMQLATFTCITASKQKRYLCEIVHVYLGTSAHHVLLNYTVHLNGTATARHNLAVKEHFDQSKVPIAWKWYRIKWQT